MGEWTAVDFQGGQRPQLTAPTLVLYHWDKCGHCKTFRPEWEKLAELASGDGVHFAEIEANEMQKVSTQYGKSFFTDSVINPATQRVQAARIIGFPTLRLYQPNTTNVIEYNGPRTALDIRQWLHDTLNEGGSSLVATQRYERRLPRQRTGSTIVPLSVSYGYRRHSRGSGHRRRRPSFTPLYVPSPVVIARRKSSGGLMERDASVRNASRRRSRSRSRSRKF